MQQIDWKKYFLVFLITAAVFLTAVGLSQYFNNRKFSSLKAIQDDISIDILSSEIQYSLLEEKPCTDANNSALSNELADFSEKIQYSQNNNIGLSDDLLQLKKTYFLLEIKDYLLMKKIAQRCNIKSSFVLFFFTDKANCDDCEKQGDALTILREKYPELRVYSFDYTLDLSAIKALTTVYNIPADLPALVINEKTYTGFQDVDTIDKIIGPALAPKAEATKAATSKQKAATSTPATVTGR